MLALTVVHAAALVSVLVALLLHYFISFELVGQNASSYFMGFIYLIALWPLLQIVIISACFFTRSLLGNNKTGTRILVANILLSVIAGLVKGVAFASAW